MARVVCVGVAVIDTVFAVEALPARPGKYFARDRREVGGGVAANAAVAVARLGGSAAIWTQVGDDDVGRRIVAGLRAEGVDVAPVETVPGLASPQSFVLVDAAGERLLVNHPDPRLFAAAGPVPEAALARADAVLADTRWPAAALPALRAATERGVPAVLDGDRPLTPAARALITAADRIVFAEPVLADLTGEGDPAAALRRARGVTDAWLAVTVGERGVYWLEHDGVRHLPAFPVKAVDTNAAGDVFHGAFALALAEGRGEAAALAFAAATAALKCTRFGGRDGIPSRAEVETMLREEARGWS